MPRLADETLRAVQRLPGTPTNGFSSIGPVRGGEPNETAIVLDGLRLYEPFHLKNFLSPVSLLDSRLIDGIEFYSGGFPVDLRRSHERDHRCHDRAARDPRYFELGLNLFHASALAASAVRRRARPRAGVRSSQQPRRPRVPQRERFRRAAILRWFRARSTTPSMNATRGIARDAAFAATRSSRSRNRRGTERAREVSQHLRVGDAGSRLVASASAAA